MANMQIFESLNFVERATSAELVQEAIMQAIVQGELRSGDPLVETELAARLGVSRGPIREALAELERMGLVDKLPYKGSFVSQLTQDDIRELYTIRTHLEGLAARCVVERAEDRAKSAEILSDILEQMWQGAQQQSPSMLVELDLKFHRTLYILSGHKLLIQIWRNDLEASLQRYLFLKQNRLYINRGEAVGLHQPIVDAIRSGDADAAEAAARRHVIEAGRRSLSEEVTL